MTPSQLVRWCVVPLFALVLSACGGSTPVAGTGGADGEMADGAASTSGGAASVGTGGSGSGGETSHLGGARTMTEEEWRASLLPRSGPHEVWTTDQCVVPGPGTSSERIGAEYVVVPTEDCNLTPTYASDRTRHCTAWPVCETSADCTEEPGGRCEGTPQEAACHYPALPTEPCDVDADCTLASEGVCLPSDETFCYPTGECRPPGSYCQYGSVTPSACESNADCVGLPGGECIKAIWFATCRYDRCTEDTDCGSGERCGCGRCVSADCADDDCTDGESCHLSAPTCARPWGFHCTTPEDECDPAASNGCLYEDGAWRHDQVLCE